MSSTLHLPPREQLYQRYCSNKHTHTRVSEREISMAAASTALTAATASTLHRTGGLAAERWRGATSILTENYCPFARFVMHNAERVLFQAAGRICSHNLAQLQEAQATTVIGGGVDQACRAIATAVERTAHRGMLRAGRARVSDPWRAWPRIGSAPAREWRKLAAGREQQSGHRGGRICLRSSRPSCRAGASVSWRRTGPRERASLLVCCARCWCRERAQQKP